MKSQSAEDKIKSVVLEVDNVFNSVGQFRKPGKRINVCDLATDLVRRSAQKQGIQANTYQINDIHQNLGGKNSFQHGFNVLIIDGVSFLVDESFCQFISPSFSNIYQDQNFSSGSFADFPILKNLQKNGYALLTDENFKDYLRATTFAKNKEYIDQVEFEKIFSDQTLMIDNEDNHEMLDEYLSGSRIFKMAD